MSAELLVSFAVNGVVLGSILALSAIGLTLVYGILNLTNFAHGDYMTFGAYLALFFNLMIVRDNDVARAATYAIVLAAALALVPVLESLLRRALGEDGARRRLVGGGKALALAALVLVTALIGDTIADVGDANLVESLAAALVLTAAWAWGWSLVRGRGLLPGLDAGATDNARIPPLVYAGVLLVLGFLVPFLVSDGMGVFTRWALWITAVVVSGPWLLGLRGKAPWDEDARAAAAGRLRSAGLVAAFFAAGLLVDLLAATATGRVPRDLLWDGALALFGLAAIAGTAGVATGHLERSERTVLYGSAVVLALLALAAWFGPENGLPRAVTNPLLLPAALAVVIVPLFSVGLDAVVWRPLRKQRATVLTLIIVSIGVALALRHLLVMQFGGGLRRYAGTSLTRINIADVILLTRTQLIIIITAFILILLVHVLLKYTRVGKGLRALSDNIELARVTGIDVDRMILYVWVIGGALTGVAGVLLAWNVNVNPNLGFQFLLPIFAAVILGGIGSPYGAMAGGLVIGIAMEVSVAWVPEYRTAVAFLILILVLLVRPQGILGGKV